jgi:hypothetical protein
MNPNPISSAQGAHRVIVVSIGNWAQCLSLPSNVTDTPCPVPHCRATTARPFHHRKNIPDLLKGRNWLEVVNSLLKILQTH